MRHRLFIHLVWTTRGRRALIDARVAGFLERYLPAVATRERAEVLAIGIVATHVHLLVRVHPLTSVSRLIKRVKGGSSAVASREGHDNPLAPLRWARGYDVSTVSERALGIVAEYVIGQAEHHPHDRIPGWTSTFGALPTAPCAPAPEPRREFIRHVSSRRHVASRPHISSHPPVCSHPHATWPPHASACPHATIRLHSSNELLKPDPTPSRQSTDLVTDA